MNMVNDIFQVTMSKNWPAIKFLRTKNNSRVASSILGQGQTIVMIFFAKLEMMRSTCLDQKSRVLRVLVLDSYSSV